MDDTYQIKPDWRKLANRVVKPRQVVVVIGASDTGKSTFCRFLADAARAKGLKVAYVDADVGQSQIGPPTTIGVKSFAPLPAEQEPMLDSGQNRKEKSIVLDGTADRIYFVGDVSPRGHFLETLTGTRLLVDSAREADAGFIIVDTTGYVHDPPAITLKQHKIELIRPDHLICIGRSTEFEQITACYSQQNWLNIHYLLPHKDVRLRSGNTRSRYRKHQFDTYFAESSIQQLPFEQIRGGRTPFFIGRPANEKELEILTRLAETQVYHAEWGNRTLCCIVSKPLAKAAITRIKNYLSLRRVTVEVATYFERRLVAFIDSPGNTYALGVIEGVDYQKRELRIRCETDAVQHACAIQFGNYQLKA